MSPELRSNREHIKKIIIHVNNGRQRKYDNLKSHRSLKIGNQYFDNSELAKNLFLDFFFIVSQHFTTPATIFLRLRQ